MSSFKTQIKPTHWPNGGATSQWWAKLIKSFVDDYYPKYILTILFIKRVIYIVLKCYISLSILYSPVLPHHVLLAEPVTQSFIDHRYTQRCQGEKQDGNVDDPFIDMQEPRIYSNQT